MKERIRGDEEVSGGGQSTHRTREIDLSGYTRRHPLCPQSIRRGAVCDRDLCFTFGDFPTRNVQNRDRRERKGGEGKRGALTNAGAPRSHGAPNPSPRSHSPHHSIANWKPTKVEQKVASFCSSSFFQSGRLKIERSSWQKRVHCGWCTCRKGNATRISSNCPPLCRSIFHSSYCTFSRRVVQQSK